MNRIIKFRGKAISNNNWIYGTGISKIIINTKETNRYNIINNCDYDELDEYWETLYDTGEVIPETIGQYTGLKDKNRKEIYEGDIIFDSFYERKAKVVFLEGAFWLDHIDDFKEYKTIHKRYQLLANYDNKSVLEVIGNIYDNKNLLEEGE